MRSESKLHQIEPFYFARSKASEKGRICPQTYTDFNGHVLLSLTALLRSCKNSFTEVPTSALLYLFSSTIRGETDPESLHLAHCVSRTAGGVTESVSRALSFKKYKCSSHLSLICLLLSAGNSFLSSKAK